MYIQCEFFPEIHQEFFQARKHSSSRSREAKMSGSGSNFVETTSFLLSEGFS